MNKETVLRLLDEMACDNKISTSITKSLTQNIDFLYELNSKVQKSAYLEYHTFNSQITQLHSLNKYFTHSN